MSYSDASLAVVLVGAGSYGVAHAQAIESATGVELVGVVDDRLERAESLARQHAVPAWAHLETAIAAARPDLVAIVVPTVAHPAIAIRALRSGANVLLEKPVSRTSAEARELVAVAAETGLVVDVVSQRRFQSANTSLKALLEDGGLGAIGSVSCDTSVWRDDSYFDDAPWRGRSELGGGNLLNHGLHALDLLVWLIGPVREASGYARRSRHPAADIEESLAAALLLGDDVPATLQASLVANPGARLELVLTGDEGTAIVTDRAVEVRKLRDGRIETERWESEDVDGALAAQYRHLRDALRDGARLRVGLESAIETLAAAETVLEALRTVGAGRP